MALLRFVRGIDDIMPAVEVASWLDFCAAGEAAPLD
jgi:hypothetical protein